MSDDLIQRLRDRAKPVKVLAGIEERGAVYRTDKPVHADLFSRAAAALAAKDAALSEMRAELAEAKRLYDVQIAGHRLSAKDATTNLIRATKAEAQLERARKALEPFVATRDQAIGEMVKTISKARDGFTPITVTVTKTQYLAAWDAVQARALASADPRCDYCKENGFQSPNLCEDCRARALASQDEGEER